MPLFVVVVVPPIRGILVPTKKVKNSEKVQKTKKQKMLNSGAPPTIVPLVLCACTSTVVPTILLL